MFESGILMISWHELLPYMHGITSTILLNTWCKKLFLFLVIKINENLCLYIFLLGTNFVVGLLGQQWEVIHLSEYDLLLIVVKWSKLHTCKCKHDIPLSSVDFTIYTPGIGTHSYSVSLRGENSAFAHFAAAITKYYNSVF